MQTLSVRIDSHINAVLSRLCHQHGWNRSEAVKTSLLMLAANQQKSAAQLAEEFGLVGGFSSKQGNLAETHSPQLKQRLREKHSG